jgi:hypothetical protein
VAGCCKRGNEALGSINCGEFLDHLRNYQLLKDCDPWSKVVPQHAMKAHDAAEVQLH